MIHAEKLYRAFDDFTLSLSLSVADNELVSLLGPSGSGKSTTLRLIAGFERPDSGQVTIDGRVVTFLPARRRDIGYVFQDFTLFPHLNVGENVAYGLRVHKVPPSERRDRVDELLELIGLEGFAKREVDTLSGGEQQRVALARALARRPGALLLDEPFSSIDSERRAELLDYVLRIQRTFGIPTIFVTHSRSDAFAISDRIVVMREGSIDAAGEPRHIYSAPTSRYSARVLGPALFLDSAETRMVRPESVEIAPGESEPAGAGSPPGAGGPDSIGLSVPAGGTIPTDTAIRATVERVIFRGATTEYRVRTQFGTLTVIRGDSSPPFQSGESVSITIPRAAVVSFERPTLR